MFGQVRANLNDQYIYPLQFSWLIYRRHKKNKTGSLHRATAIDFAKSIFEQSLSHLNNWINLELCLVRYEPISMTNIFIRCSSPGLFAGGVKKIRREYCIGSLQYFLQSLFFEQSFSHLYNLINLELCLVRYEPISMTNIFIRCCSPSLFAGGVKKISRVCCAVSLQ